MSVAVYLQPNNMTLAQFREIHSRLEDAGEAHNPHRLHHSCFGDDGELMVYDVWDSPESFDTHCSVLMPILAEVGVDLGKPSVMPLHMLLQASAIPGVGG